MNAKINKEGFKSGVGYRFFAGLWRIVRAFLVLFLDIVKAFDQWIIALTEEVSGFINLLLGQSVAKGWSVYVALGLCIALGILAAAIPIQLSAVTIWPTVALGIVMAISGATL